MIKIIPIIIHVINKKYLEYGINAKKNSENFYWSKIIEKYKKIL